MVPSLHPLTRQADMADDSAPEEKFPVKLPSIRPDTQSLLAGFIVASFVGVIILVVFHPPPQEQAATIFTLIGGLSTLAAGVGSYYFGSSKGSVSKDESRDQTLTTLVNKVVQNGENK